jgi:hypothetical protein
MTREQHAVTRLHWLKRGLKFVAVAWLGLAVLVSALLLLDAWRLDRAADRQHASALANRVREAQLLAGVGGTVAVERRQQAVQTWQSVAMLDHDPAVLFQRVLSIGQQIGGLRFQRMEWAMAPNGITPTLGIEGEIAPFDNDFRAAHQRVQNLLKQLAASLSAGQIIHVTRWPLDAASSSELEGEFGHSQVNARFRIEISGAAE